MPRPTDVVFRNFNELTYIAREDIIPRLPYTPTYPKKLLVNLVESNPEGSREYWLLESGKTLRISRPSAQPHSYPKKMLTQPQTPQKSRSTHHPTRKILSPTRILRSRSPSKPLPTPLISPCQSFCYPPSHPRRPLFLPRFKFWERTKQRMIEKEGTNGGLNDQPSQGSEFERRMWRAERSSFTRRRLQPSELSMDPEHVAGVTDSDEDDTTEDQFNRYPHSSSRRTVSLSSSPRVLKYCHSMSRSSSTLPPIVETKEPVEQYSDPLVVPRHDVTFQDSEVDHSKHDHEPYSPEYIQCPMFNYRGNPDWDRSPFIERILVLYFSVPFCAPWFIVACIKLVFCWVPFFSRIVDLITGNGGCTVLFLLSHLGFGLAAVPLFLVPVFGWPFCLVHRLVVFGFRGMPWYRFKYSLGCPGVLKDDGSTQDANVSTVEMYSR